LGEFVEKYLHKGIKIAVSGRIQTGSYKNKDGNTIYTTDVVIEEIEFAESKKSEQPSEPNESNEPNESDGFMDVPDDLGLPFGTKM
jgi:single-strand DNA-binding protein